jgi:hypothetical protein
MPSFPRGSLSSTQTLLLHLLDDAWCVGWYMGRGQRRGNKAEEGPWWAADLHGGATRKAIGRTTLTTHEHRPTKTCGVFSTRGRRSGGSMGKELRRQRRQGSPGTTRRRRSRERHALRGWGGRPAVLRVEEVDDRRHQQRCTRRRSTTGGGHLEEDNRRAEGDGSGIFSGARSGSRWRWRGG